MMTNRESVQEARSILAKEFVYQCNHGNQSKVLEEQAAAAVSMHDNFSGAQIGRAHV